MEEYLGTIKLFGFNFAPRGWMTCQGQILSIAQNSALFSLLGTTYGGNGQTTFGLPNLAGRVGIGQGQLVGGSAYVMGEAGGTENTTLLSTQMPNHTHTATAATTAILSAESTQANAQNPNGKCLASGTNIYADEDPAQNRQMATSCIAATTTVTIAAAGGSQPFKILQPFLVMNYAICTSGIFPPRN
jgi:microcystin-dependent protein